MLNLRAKFAAVADRFVDPATFGTEGWYQLAAGGVVALNVSFAREYEGSDPSGLEFVNSGPAAFFRAADVPQAGPHDVLVIEEEVFFVKEIRKGPGGLHIAILTENPSSVLLDQAGNFVLTQENRFTLV